MDKGDITQEQFDEAWHLARDGVLSEAQWEDIVLCWLRSSHRPKTIPKTIRFGLISRCGKRFSQCLHVPMGTSPKDVEALVERLRWPHEKVVYRRGDRRPCFFSQTNYVRLDDYTVVHMI